MDIKFSFSVIGKVFSTICYFLSPTRRRHCPNEFLLINFIVQIPVCSGVVIKNLTVPKTYVLDHNTAEPPKPLILDCDFEESPDDTGVVIKWLFNNFPIYQWIPGSHPITLQKFKPHLDPLYRASEDSREMYKAISILNPTWNMTGNYTCSLLSFTSSDKQSAQLIVIGKNKRGYFIISDTFLGTLDI